MEDSLKTMIMGALSTDSFIPVNKRLIRYFKGDATLALLLCELISIYKYQRERGSVDELEAFPVPINFLKSTLGMSAYKQKRALDALQDEGFIYISLQGRPSSRWVAINFEKLYMVLSDEFESKPSKETEAKKAFYEGINEAVKTQNTEVIEQKLDNMKDPLKGCVILVTKYIGYRPEWTSEAVGRLKHVVRSMNKYYYQNVYDYGRFADLIKMCNKNAPLLDFIKEMMRTWRKVYERPLNQRIYDWKEVLEKCQL